MRVLVIFRQKNLGFCIKDPASTLPNKTKGAYLDCVGHEYTHDVLHKKTKLRLFNKASTVNEAYADIVGSFINNNQWRTSSRDIGNPNNTNNSSSIGDTYYDFKFKGEHLNLTIISHAAYLMENTYKFSFDKLHKLWYNSTIEGCSYGSDFDTVRENVINSARRNHFTHDEIADIVIPILFITIHKSLIRGR